MSANPHDENKVGYNQWVFDSERKARAGIKQRYCIIHGRWVWPDEAYPDCETITAEEWEAQIARAEREVKKYAARQEKLYQRAARKAAKPI